MPLNVSLTPRLEQFVRAKVESGRYTSASEVVREALRLLEQAESAQAARLDALRSDVLQALDETDSGDLVSYDSADVKRAGRARRSA